MSSVVLYFGSFNPVHNGHTSVAGYVLEKGLCDELWFVVSPQNPFKRDDMLAPEQDRLAMAEIAVREKLTGLPVVVSDIEFMMPKPSYTIDTLRLLGGKYPQHEFSLLAGTDILGDFHNWKEPEAIAANHRFLIYPREGYENRGLTGNMVLLEDAPKWDYSSTDVREALLSGRDTGGMLANGVVAYIREHGLWQVSLPYAGIIEELGRKITLEPENAGLYIERGKAYYKTASYHDALNDFIKARDLAPDNSEAAGYIELINEIFEYRYKDYYNP